MPEPIEHMPASFDSINYALRINKAVERRLIVEGVGHLLAPLGSASTFRYIGFGSMWFIDFLLMHKQLRVTDMYSIEKTPYRSRAEYNKPYECIRVIAGDSSIILAGNTIRLQEKHSIVWMDYDGKLDASCLTDIENLCGRLPVKSIIMVTVNAHFKSYILKDPEGIELSLEESLRRLAGDFVPRPFPGDCASVQQFPPVLADILTAKMLNAVRTSQAGLEFLPIFNFVYADVSPMITVGGMIVDSATRQTVEPLLPQLDYATQAEQYYIDVPPLTPKEKMALDQMHPRDVPLTPSEAHTALSFKLSPTLLRNYHRLYRLYPSFSELAP